MSLAVCDLLGNVPPRCSQQFHHVLQTLGPPSHGYRSGLTFFFVQSNLISHYCSFVASGILPSRGSPQDRPQREVLLCIGSCCCRCCSSGLAPVRRWCMHIAAEEVP